MDESRQQLRRKQRDAIWKWRWLGFRHSTPGFKGSLVLVAAAIVLLTLYGLHVI